MLQTQVFTRRYKILDRIGQGGMGEVFRAIDRLTGAPVAFKRVLAASNEFIFTTSRQAGDPVLALANEFRTLASMRHPNIISVLDYGFTKNRDPFFTMELLEDSLNILDASKNKPLSVRLDYIIQMLQALTYLHRRGIVHRDVKPDNIHVIDDRVKVLDFGLAIRRDIDFDDSSVDSDVLVGTLAYMAPEVLAG